MYSYEATVAGIHDGDTLTLDIDLGLETTRRVIVRLYGLNAPELGTPEGATALAFVQDWIGSVAQPLVVDTVKDHREKYGRYLATIQGPAGSLNRALIDSGNAVPYLVPPGYWVTHT